MRACRACAPCCAGCGQYTHHKRALHRREVSFFPCKTVVRRASCLPPTCGRHSVARSPAPLRWMSLGRWENTQSCRARAPCRACFDSPKRYERALHRQEASHSRCKTVVRQASCGLQQRTAGFRMTDTQAPLRRLSLRRWRNTRACRVRAPCRTGHVQFKRYESALHRQEASLLPCKAVVRRTSCCLQRAAGIRVALLPAPLRRLSLGRWRNT